MNRAVSALRRFVRVGALGVHHTLASRNRRPFQFGTTDVRTALDRLEGTSLPGPSFRANDVTDHGDLGFVADPFLYVEDRTQYFTKPLS